MNHERPVSAVGFGAATPDAQGGASEPRLVLVVSEDPLMLRAVGRLLRQAGYEIVARQSEVASAGSDDPRRPALVIIDVPDDWSRRANGGAYRPVGYLDAPRVLWIGDAAMLAGERGEHLTKPFTGSELLARIAALLDG